MISEQPLVAKCRKLQKLEATLLVFLRYCANRSYYLNNFKDDVDQLCASSIMSDSLQPYGM